ncbi:glycosyltransferase [Fulvivirgaceae bacterium BMA10]|uniref:Glycosyltransferase n=1 Tax=Splendidivirga corallicola TaxID=3051826 RepID=A0ABT8KI91_9BACT|nr:glycosyltransferase [Fulvivirgaceae bacterium BMA10]
MDRNPELSIIVCTYNREKYLPKALEHLKMQTAQSNVYEIVIVNNKSTDNTDSICRDFISKNTDLNIVYCIENNQGHTYSRNRGIEESNGQYLAFIDDDAFVCNDYVKSIINFFETHTEVSAIGGKIIPVYEGKAPNWMTKYLLPLVSALDMGDKIKKFKGAKFPIGANMAYRREVFKKYGQFDVRLGRRGSGLEGGDEKELIIRLKKNEEAVFYVPEMLVDHIIPDRRLQMEYIKGLARGVANSERKRLKKAGISDKLKKVISELVKIGGTIVLSLWYYLTFQFPKGNMLLKFRYWVLTGYLKNE